MAKIEISGKITDLKQNVYPSGCCLTQMKLSTTLFDCTTQNLTVNCYNNEDIKFADIAINDYQVDDCVKVIAELKPCEYISKQNSKPCRTVQFVAKGLQKINE